MNRIKCVKCGSYEYVSPSYRREMTREKIIEFLRYVCPNCGYTWTRPTADQELAQVKAETVERCIKEIKHWQWNDGSIDGNDLIQALQELKKGEE